MSRFREQFSKRVRAAREALGLRQADVAKRMKLNHDTEIAYYESGKRLPGPERLRALCMALKISADELLGLKSKK
jgi:transcriptional regulator with XRE-family HTH domain